MPSRRGNNNQAQGNRRGNYLDRLEETNGTSVRKKNCSFKQSFFSFTTVETEVKEEQDVAEDKNVAEDKVAAEVVDEVDSKPKFFQIIREWILRLPLFNSFTFWLYFFWPISI